MPQLETFMKDKELLSLFLFTFARSLYDANAFCLLFIVVFLLRSVSLLPPTH